MTRAMMRIATAAASLAMLLTLQPTAATARGALIATGSNLFAALQLAQLVPPPTSAQFFYDDNGKPAGPLSLSEIAAKIASGAIKPDTLMWKGGMPSWVPAKDLLEVAALLQPAKPAVAVEDLVFDNLSFAIADFAIKIPRLSVTGSSLSKSALQSLFEGQAGLQMADQLSKLDAASILIPEIRFATSAPGADDPTIIHRGAIRDLRLDNIVGGKVGRVVWAGMTDEIVGHFPMSVALGAFHASDYDLPGVMRFIYASTTSGEAQRQLIGASSFEGLRVRSPNAVEISAGQLTIGAIKARPTTMALADFIVWSIAAANSGKPMARADMAKFFGTIADLFDAFSVDGISLSEIGLKAQDPSFRNGSLKTLKLGSIANARFAEFGAEGLDVNVAAGHAKFDRAAILGLDLRPFVKAVAEAAKTGDIRGEGLRNIDWLVAAPRLDGIVVKGVDAGVAAGMLPKSLTLAGFELGLGKYVGPAPTAIHIQMDHLAGDPAFVQESLGLRALYTKNFDISCLIDVLWDEAAKTISLDEISKGVEMGSVLLKGTLRHVERELFAGTLPQVEVAALGVTLADVSLGVENAGLADWVIEQEAKRRNTTRDKIQSEYGTQVALGIPRILGNSDQAKTLANAVAAFIANPKSLSVSVKTKDAYGLGITDVIVGGAPIPAAIFDKLDVTAVANK